MFDTREALPLTFRYAIIGFKVTSNYYMFLKNHYILEPEVLMAQKITGKSCQFLQSRIGLFLGKLLPGQLKSMEIPQGS